MNKITAEIYEQNPERYTLVKGNVQGAPSCRFVNTSDWVGYDKEKSTFVRFTKSVFKRLVNQIHLKQDFCRFSIDT
ncbi:hypothetical protein [Olivibacter sp. XZL3]|uniref:hypothetical protein n=1 Tax=Olivibacter sp. XZL3 TaxID=1735116 RepID=UPI001066D7C2|nr:hypothetical protein [Olivibacter sp. XZL3]